MGKKVVEPLLFFRAQAMDPGCYSSLFVELAFVEHVERDFRRVSSTGISLRLAPPL
jgi:hypothetical protein